MSTVAQQLWPVPELSEGRCGVAGSPSLRVLEGLVRDVTQAEDLVLVTTVPGGGALAAAAIDRAQIAPIVGTVAGEATVVARTRSPLSAQVVARYLRSVARGAATEGRLG